MFLDITASSDDRDTMVHVVERVAEQVFIPFTVGGGVRTVEDVRRMLRAGADKVSLNTAAVDDPSSSREVADEFGAQCIVVAIDARRRNADDRRRLGGRDPRRPHADRPRRDRVGRARVRRSGAGEILLTSMDRDGTKAGYDIELLQAMGDAVNVPVIASGGVGTLEHLYEGVAAGGAGAVLAASIFHFGQHTVARGEGVPRRSGPHRAALT